MATFAATAGGLIALCLAAIGPAWAGSEADAYILDEARDYLDLCARIEPIPPEEQGGTLLANGFRPFDEGFAGFLRSYYEERGQLLTAATGDNDFVKRWRDTAAEINDQPVAFHGRIPRFFINEDNWLLRLESPSYLGAVRGVEPWGEAHACRFYGTGWMPEDEAEALLATFVGEDFEGRGLRDERLAELYVVTAEPRDASVPYPYLSVKAILPAGELPGQSELYFSYVRDATRPAAATAGAYE